MPAAPPAPPPVSREPGFVIPAARQPVLRGQAVAGMRCAGRGAVDAVHIEIFVDRKVLLLPAGIGLRPPLRRAGLSRLAGGACAYPLHTLDPTGTVLVEEAFGINGPYAQSHAIAALAGLDPRTNPTPQRLTDSADKALRALATAAGKSPAGGAGSGGGGGLPLPLIAAGVLVAAGIGGGVLILRSDRKCRSR